MEKTKYYYKIGEVAKELGVSTSLLRAWEKQFPGLRPKKAQRGVRQYTVKDIQYLKDIQKLVQNNGYTLQGACDAMKRAQRDLAGLRQIRKFLLDLREKLD